MIIAIIIHVLLIMYIFSVYYNLNDSKKAEPVAWCIVLYDLGYPPSIKKDNIQLLEKIAMTTSLSSRDMTVLEPQPVAAKDAEIITIRTQDELSVIKTFMDDISIEYINLVYFHQEKDEDKVM